MTGFLLGAALAICALLVVALFRVWTGPTVFDRLVAVALVTANTVVVLVLVAAVLDRTETIVDIAIGYALLAFILPVALGKHFESRRSARGVVGDAAMDDAAVEDGSVDGGAMDDGALEGEATP